MIENINDIDDIRAILDYKRAEAAEKLQLPDLEEERRRFWQRYAEDSVAETEAVSDNEESIDSEHHHARSARRWKRWCIAASSVAALFFGVFLTVVLRAPQPDPMQVFTASESAHNSLLEFDNDTYVIKGEKPDQSLIAHGIIATDNYIDLRNKSGKHPGSTPHTLTLTTPCGKDYTVTLSDGTTVLLNAGSQLIFPDEFGKENREVYLKGEAMFDVAHDKDHPFIVKTDYFETKVLGTKFNLRSYSKEDTHVTLIEGKVTVSKESAPELTLKPNEQVAIDPHGDLKKQTVDTYPYLEWQNGFFYFDNVALSQIMEELGRWYNVDVVFRTEKLLNYRMHFVASREESLMEAVRNLNALGIFYVTLDGKRIIIQ